MRDSRRSWALLPFALLWAPVVHAGEVVPNPYAPTGAPVVLDFSRGPLRVVEPPAPRFEDLDRHRDVPETDLPQGQLPEGWVQEGGVVVPRAIAEGAEPRSYPELGELRPGRDPSRGKVDGPGVEELCGENSAENQSTLARSGHPFPVYGGGEERAIAVAQAVQADFAEMAVRVVYLERPPKRLPYVMIMMGGTYKDTSSGPAGGVAPGADCEDNGLRNVCFAFVRNDSISTQALKRCTRSPTPLPRRSGSALVGA